MIWLVPPQHLTLDIETMAGDPCEAEAALRRSFSPSPSWKPATIGERYLQALADKQAKLALLDTAPILSVALRTESDCRLLHWMPLDDDHVSGVPLERFTKPDLRKVEDLRRRFGIEQGDIVVGCVSRPKKQEQLIRAVSLCDPSIKVLLVGVPPGTYDGVAREVGLRNPVLYAGIVDSVSVLDYYHLFTVNTLCSVTDGFGLVLVESMACGVPVIGTKWGGIADVIEDGVSGLLYENERHEELARHIRAVVGDSALRETLIRNGLRRAREFSIEKTIDEYEAFFSQLVDLRGG